MHLNDYIDGENIDTFIQEFYSKILMDSVLDNLCWLSNWKILKGKTLMDC